MHVAVLAWFLATAYCQSGDTRSGVPAQSGIVAADPNVIPFGSLVRIKDRGLSRLYRVLDTGRAIKGRRIDIYLPNCRSARAFGTHRVLVRILSRE